MKVFETNESLQLWLNTLIEKGKTIGFVPTMGALHEGHAALIRKSMRTTDVTVCSIFVNPTQFNDAADLAKYPRTLDNDTLILKRNQCDILYLPSKSEIYPPGLNVDLALDFGHMMSVLEGEFRPGHFDGVVMVVNRLLDIVKPDYLFLGQKDFQQFTIIQYMIDQLKLPVSLVVCRTKRAKNGLAMSSRNLRLDGDLKERAAIINKTLLAVKRKIKTHSFKALKKYAIEKMTIPDFVPEYFEIVNGHNLKPVDSFDESDYIVACTAVWAKNVRLIDNRILKKPTL